MKNKRNITVKVIQDNKDYSSRLAKYFAIKYEKEIKKDIKIVKKRTAN